jgi:hypothetical protein
MEGARMAKKLESNGLWESSRMIIPQHKVAALQQAAAAHAIPRPVMDEQDVVLISEALMRSKAHQLNITVTLYDEYQPRTLTGTVSKVDRMQFKLDTVDLEDGSKDWEWIVYTDVIKAELKDSGE